jgi:hypothetical protein
MTPTGPKCLLVVGQGPLNNYQFQRLVYDGEFRLDDYRNQHQELLPLEVMRSQLAGRSLAEVRPSNLWEVLGNPSSSAASGNSLPRINILPVRSRDEYRSFRDAFIRLLALTNVSARELRQLLITCHARDITCDKIDVAVEHREEFELAEQVERAMHLTRAVMAKVDEGRAMRETLDGHSKQLRAEARPVGAELATVRYLLARLASDTEQQNEAGRQKENELSNKVDGLNQRIGELTAKLSQQQAEMGELERLHHKWSACTAEMLDTMRENGQR